MRHFVFALFAALILAPAAIPQAAADSCPAKTYVYTHPAALANAGQRVPVHGNACLVQGELGEDLPVDTAFINPGADSLHVVHQKSTVGASASLTVVLTGLGFSGDSFSAPAKNFFYYQTAEIGLDADETLVCGATLVVDVYDGLTLLDSVTYHTVC